MLESIFQNPAIFWIIFGITTLLLELIVPGFIIIFFGVGALITALITWLIPAITTDFQLLIFLLSSGLFLALFRKTIRKSFSSANNPQSDEVEQEFVGKKAKAIEDFVSNTGKVDFKGSTWTATSSDTIQKGDIVEIIKQDSIILEVKIK